jgi:hypothetical protein
MKESSNLPHQQQQHQQQQQYMKAVHGINYGDIDEMLSVVDHVPLPPRLLDLPKQQQKQNKNFSRCISTW